MGKVTRWSKELVQKYRVATTVPFHLMYRINPPTLCEMELRKFLGLEIFWSIITISVLEALAKC